MAIETTHPRVHVRDAAAAPISLSNRRMLASCFLGTTIEWYDFLVYGFLAPLALNRLFFPSLSPLAGTIAGLRRLRRRVRGPAARRRRLRALR